MHPAAHVFISYARDDGRPYAEELYRGLTQHGLRAWRDERSLNPFQDFSVGIERAIKDASHILVCLTPSIAAREDSFVRREIIYAQVHRKPITPILLAGFKPEDIPITLIHLTWMKIEQVASGMSDILNRLSAAPVTETPDAVLEDPFHAHVRSVLDFAVAQLEQTVLNITDLLALTARDTPAAVMSPLLAPAYRNRGFSINPPPEEVKTPDVFADFHAGFSAHKGRVLLLGEPGAGKSTTLLAFAREKAYERLAHPGALLPVYAPIATWKPGRDVVAWLAEAANLDQDALKAETEGRRAILLLDGLDELPNAAQSNAASPHQSQIGFIDQVQALRTPILITCRVQDYEGILKDKGSPIALDGALTLQPLADAQIERYLADQPELWLALTADPALMDMARTPLLLTLLGVGYRDSTAEERQALKDLTGSPALLRDKIFRQYVEKRWQFEQAKYAEPLPFTVDDLYALLGRAAMMSIDLG